jgi:cytochrome c-type biogenesis protein CcmH/NrfG
MHSNYYVKNLATEPMKSTPFEQLTDLEPDEREYLSKSGKLFLSISAKHRQCPDPSLLAAFKANILTDELTRALTRHTEHCRLCAKLAQDMAEIETSPLTAEEKDRIHIRVKNVIHETRTGVNKTGFRRWIPTAAYATLVLLIMGSGIFTWHSLQQSHKSYVTSEQSIFQVEKATVKLPITLTMRGESNVNQTYATALEYALEPYKSNHYAEAVKRLIPLTQHYPEGAEGYYYLAVSQMMLEQYSVATKNLKRAEQLLAGQPSGVLSMDEVDWFWIVAQIHVGHRSEAEGELQKLCQTAGDYQTRACTGLKELSMKD